MLGAADRWRRTDCRGTNRISCLSFAEILASRYPAKKCNISDGGFCVIATRARVTGELLQGRLLFPRVPAQIPTLVQVRWTEAAPSGQNCHVGLQHVISDLRLPSIFDVFPFCSPRPVLTISVSPTANGPGPFAWIPVWSGRQLLRPHGGRATVASGTRRQRPGQRAAQ